MFFEMAKQIDGGENMRNFVIAMLALTIMAGVLMSGCVEPQPQATPRNLAIADSNFLASHLQKPHELRKMFEKDVNSSSSSWSAGFFLFFGGAGGSSKTETVTMVRFAWEDKDGSYIISDLPLKEVRVKISEGTETPTISFHLNEAWEEISAHFIWYDTATRKAFDDSPEEFFRAYLSYAEITCSEKDWPENINLPLN